MYDIFHLWPVSPHSPPLPILTWGIHLKAQLKEQQELITHFVPTRGHVTWKGTKPGFSHSARPSTLFPPGHLPGHDTDNTLTNPHPDNLYPATLSQARGDAVAGPSPWVVPWVPR